jgi:hypothetical protein
MRTWTDQYGNRHVLTRDGEHYVSRRLLWGDVVIYGRYTKVGT